MEYSMDNQTLQSDEEPRAGTVTDLARKLRKREQRLLGRLQEVQEKEARALERLRRAEARLQRRSARLERVLSHLLLVRQQLAHLQLVEQQPEQVAPVIAVTATSEVASTSDTEVNVSPAQADLAPTGVATTNTTTQPELIAAPGAPSDTTTTPVSELVSPSDSNAVVAVSEPAATTATEPELISTPDTTPGTSTTTGVEPSSTPVSESEAPTRLETEVDATPEVATSPEHETALSASQEQPSGSIAEPEATTSPVVEQESQPTSESPAQAAAQAKEAWAAAEAEVQSARNTAHGIAASISFLSQTGGLSNELMAELLRRQSEANKALTKAQYVARLAYGKFVQKQQASERAASQQAEASTGATEHHTQQDQENGASPAEDSAVDLTGKMHAIHLYKPL